MSNQNNIGPASYLAIPPKSRVRRGAWILLLLVALLTMMIGLCMGSAMCGTSWCVDVFEGGAGAKAVPPGPATQGSVAPFFWGITLVLLVVPLSVGVIEIVCSMKIRKGSRGAVLAAALLVGLQLVGIALMMVITMIQAFTGARDSLMQTLVIALLFYGVVGTMLSLTEYLLIKVIREKREPVQPV